MQGVKLAAKVYWTNSKAFDMDMVRESTLCSGVVAGTTRKTPKTTDFAGRGFSHILEIRGVFRLWLASPNVLIMIPSGETSIMVKTSSFKFSSFFVAQPMCKQPTNVVRGDHDRCP